MIRVWLLFFIAQWYSTPAVPLFDKVRVSTNSGTVIGRRTLLKPPGSSTTAPFYEFFNVPYASPPVGKLRFSGARGRDADNTWEGEVDASVERDVRCVQVTWYPGTDGIGQEDCLYLTIRTRDVTRGHQDNQTEKDAQRKQPIIDGYTNNQPEGVTKNTSQSENVTKNSSQSDLRPVVVWLHGGGLFGRSCCLPGYSPDPSLTDELDVVTVNVNYRLGFLGFHSISELWDKEEGVYANNGIRDMITSLQWIRDNIASFGGDPDKVTVLGQSGGGTGALGLIVSPLAVNLFQQLMVFSPAGEFRWDHEKGDEFQRRVSHVLRVTGCDNQSDNSISTSSQSKARIKECLRSVNAKWFTSHISPHINPSGRLLDYHSKVGRGWNEFPLTHGTVGEQLGLVMVDPVVVTSSPAHISSAKHLKKIRGRVRVMLSNLAHETVFDSTNRKYSFTNKTAVVDHIRSLTSSTFNLTEDQLTDLLTPYLHLPPQKIWDTLVSDMRVTCPLNSLAEEISASEKHDVYRVYTTTGPSWSRDTTSDTIFDSTVYHGWDTEALFGFRARIATGLPVTESDLRYRRTLVNALKKFIEGEEVVSQKEMASQRQVVSDPQEFRRRGGMDSLYPGSYILIEGGEGRHVKGKLALDRCSVLRELKLDKYGWQN